MKSAPSILLNSLSSNMSKKILNRIKGIIEVLFYANNKYDKDTQRKIREAKRKNESELTLEKPPNYIVVTLLDNKIQKFR